jgi:alkaline phosphatase D
MSVQFLKRYAVASCNHQHEGGMWDLISNNSPDYLMLLGDNIYNDIKTKRGSFIESTPELINKNYNQWAADNSWQTLVASIGNWSNILATWDDHDYGINDGDEHYKYRNQSLESFLRFFRIPTEGRLQLQFCFCFFLVHFKIHI